MSIGKIEKIAILGGGVIGSSWATNFIWKGLPVNVYDVDDTCLKLAQERITGNLKYLANKDIITSEKLIEAISLITYTADIEEAVTDVQFIQEAGPERYETKQAILADCDQYAPSDAVFATSSSGLFITEIARYSKIPERCIGAHPYNPPHLIPLVEIGKGEKTSEETVRKTYDFYRGLGKEPIVLQKEALGFIANRLSVALYREAIDLVLKGVCSVEDIDKTVSYGPGLRYALMGPNLIYQLGGGAYGIQGILHHIGPSVELWWADMADWKKWPAGWAEKAQKGINEAMANRHPEQGRTPEDIIKWRDDKLLEILKMLGKL